MGEFSNTALTMSNILASVVFFFLFALCHAQNLTNVDTALFSANEWTLNLNYLSANSSDFWRTFILKTECDTVVKFQEVFCMGKSVNVTATNLFNSTDVRHLVIQSNQTFSCSSNLQDPNVAALDNRYSKGQLVLPGGTFSIAMKLDNFTQVLGYRGYALKAQLPLDRLVVASKCRERHNPNNS